MPFGKSIRSDAAPEKSLSVKRSKREFFPEKENSCPLSVHPATPRCREEAIISSKSPGLKTCLIIGLFSPRLAALPARLRLRQRARRLLQLWQAPQQRRRLQPLRTSQGQKPDPPRK
jgi:hypothetical protein